MSKKKDKSIDHNIKKSFKRWKKDRFLNVYFWVCALIGIAMLLSIKVPDLYYILGSILIIFTIIAVINHRSRY